MTNEAHLERRRERERLADRPIFAFYNAHRPSAVAYNEILGLVQVQRSDLTRIARERRGE